MGHLRMCLLALLGVCFHRSVETFVMPPSKSSSLFGSSTTTTDWRPTITPQPFTVQHRGWMKLLAKGGKKDDDDGWDEPNEEDLMGDDFEDISMDDVDVEEIEDDSILVVDEDDEDEDDDNDEDEDDDDDDIDIWAEDEDDDDDDDEDEEVAEEEDEDYDYEYEYEDIAEETTATEGYMGGETGVDDLWDDEEEGEDIPLQDDPDDPNYMTAKKLVEETIARREQLAKDKDFDPIDFAMNHMTEEQAMEFQSLPEQQEVDRIGEPLKLDAADFEGMDLEEEAAKTPDLMYDDPYENEGEEDILGTGVSDDDMEKLDKAYKEMQDSINAEPWDKVSLKAETIKREDVSNQTLIEMNEALEIIGGSAYNCSRWLLYDLDFNVSNLILAAVQHNPEAPILFQHWYPQLLCYERYQHARDREFDFNWDDVNSADMSELERYYLGFGYTEIPKKAPYETGIIDFGELDEEELKMAAFENWMTEVYNPEWDRKDFDDDDFRDEDNVFSDFYKAPQHPDLPSFEDAQEDLAEWEEKAANETVAYREFYGKTFEYTNAQTKEFETEFRGHLVIACCPLDSDLEIAEKITAKMKAAFGEKVYVETRVIAHAREEDTVFEIWLESYDIDLLHSKKKASSGSEEWDGPAECDDAQIEYLVERVGFLISDEARYSYRYDLELV